MRRVVGWLMVEGGGDGGLAWIVYILEALDDAIGFKGGHEHVEDPKARE